MGMGGSGPRCGAQHSYILGPSSKEAFNTVT